MTGEEASRLVQQLTENVLRARVRDLEQQLAAAEASRDLFRQERDTLEAVTRYMTDGGEAEVHALIAMAIRLVADPDARVLLRHVGAQGERMSRMRDRLKQAHSVLCFDWDRASDQQRRDAVVRIARDEIDACLRGEP